MCRCATRLTSRTFSSMVWNSGTVGQVQRSEELDNVRSKPLKRRGLSKYYSSKSQSFSSLELALATPYGESAMGLAKHPSSMDLTSDDFVGTSYSRSATSLPGQPTTTEEQCLVPFWLCKATEDVCAALRLSKLSIQEQALSRQSASSLSNLQSMGNSSYSILVAPGREAD